MKYSRIDSSGVPITTPVSYVKVLHELSMSCPEELLTNDFLMPLGWVQVPVSKIPHPPVEVREQLGKCIVTLGVPTVSTTGDIVRTFNFSVASNAHISKAAATVRLKRNKLLEISDWVELPDVELTPELREEWRIYRKALRDIPSQENFPLFVVYPTTP